MSTNDFACTENNDFYVSTNGFILCNNDFLSMILHVMKTMIFMSLPTVLHFVTMIFYQWFCVHWKQWFLCLYQRFYTLDNDFLPMILCVLKTMIFMSLTTILHTSTMVFYQWFDVYYKQWFSHLHQRFHTLCQWFLF